MSNVPLDRYELLRQQTVEDLITEIKSLDLQVLALQGVRNTLQWALDEAQQAQSAPKEQLDTP